MFMEHTFVMCLWPGSRTCQTLSEWGKVRPQILTEYPEIHEAGLANENVISLLFKRKNSKICSDGFRNLEKNTFKAQENRKCLN